MWIALSDGLEWSFGKPQEDYYNLLVEGLLDGGLGLKAEVAPELLACPDPYDPAQRPAGSFLHDTALYQGKYYIYHSAVPALFTLLPYRVLTGTSLPLGAAVLFFCILGFVGAVVLAHHLAKHLALEAGRTVQWAAMVMLGLGSLSAVLLRRHSLYDLPIAAGSCFVVWALVYFTRHIAGEGRNTTALVFCSLLSGLAIACRPIHLALAALPLLGLLARPSTRGDRAALMRQIVAAGLPLSLVAAAVGLYNYLRFDNPLEFGVRYVLSGVYEGRITHFSPGYFLNNLVGFWLAPVEWLRFFPFYGGAPETDFLAADAVRMGSPLGLLWHAPWLLLSLVPLIPCTRGLLHTAPGARGRGWFILGPALAGISSLGFLLCFYWIAERYLADFLPQFGVLAFLGLLLLSDKSSRWPSILRHGSGLLLGCVLSWSVFAFAAHAAALHGRMEENNQGHFWRLAKHANRPVHLFEDLVGTPYGDLQFALNLPSPVPVGSEECLVETGQAGRKDRLWLCYTSEQTLRFRYEHSHAPSVTSEEVRIEEGRSPHLRLRMGSLYPPPSHPEIDRLEEGSRDGLIRRLFLSWDGRVLFDRHQDFYRNEGLCVKLGMECGEPHFTGTYSDVKRIWPRDPEPVPSPFPAHNLATGLRLRVCFPSLDKGLEPLLSLGVTGRGNVVQVEYLGANKLRFRFVHWGREPLVSDPFEYQPGQAQALEIDHPALRFSKAARERSSQGNLVLRVDGREVWRVFTRFYPANIRDLRLGEDPLGGTSGNSAFSGSIKLEP